MLKLTSSVLVLIAGLVVAAAPVRAQEVCVACSEPEATYKCTVKDADRAANIRGVGRALEYLCITELARAGGHYSCRASREYAGPCIGQPRLIELGKAPDPPPGAAQGQGQGQQADGAAIDPNAPVDATQKGGKRPPRTLEEMARESAEKSKQQLESVDQSFKKAAQDTGKTLENTGAAMGEAVKKTGSAVGDAVKKTGTAMGDVVHKSGEAVKKSVVCIVTLFTDCWQGEPKQP